MAICDTCGEPYGALDSTNHNLEKISAKGATVTEFGNTEYWHCLDCDKYFVDENGESETKFDDTVISKLPPEIIEGNGQSIATGSNQPLTFRSKAGLHSLRQGTGVHRTLASFNKRDKLLLQKKTKPNPLGLNFVSSLRQFTLPAYIRAQGTVPCARMFR